MKWLIAVLAGMATLFIVFANSYFLHGYEESKNNYIIIKREFEGYEEEFLALFDELPLTFGSLCDDCRDFLRCEAGIECSNKFANKTLPPKLESNKFANETLPTRLKPNKFANETLPAYLRTWLPPKKIQDYVEVSKELEYFKNLTPTEQEETKQHCYYCAMMELKRWIKLFTGCGCFFWNEDFGICKQIQPGAFSHCTLRMDKDTETKTVWIYMWKLDYSEFKQINLERLVGLCWGFLYTIFGAFGIIGIFIILVAFCGGLCMYFDDDFTG